MNIQKWLQKNLSAVSSKVARFALRAKQLGLVVMLIPKVVALMTVAFLVCCYYWLVEKRARRLKRRILESIKGREGKR